MTILAISLPYGMATPVRLGSHITSEQADLRFSEDRAFVLVRPRWDGGKTLHMYSTAMLHLVVAEPEAKRKGAA